MILTEEEAKTKRCQESYGDTNVTPGGFTTAGQYTAGSYSAGTSFAVTSSPSMCIASGCMAWRWQYGELDAEAPRPGYCGKAGRPTP